MKKFYSNGKLFITGEYVVLDGATAFALPTKFGQDLVVENGSGQQINWKSIDSNGSVWFEDIISFEAIQQRSKNNNAVTNTLIEILHAASLLNPAFLKSDGYAVTTTLTFPRFWGLGTSSTLINNIAQWLKIDAFILLKNSFGGSGYDIACAQNNTAVLYQIGKNHPIIRTIDFKPEFADQLYFVYLNKKQSSKSAIQSYYEKRHDIDSAVSRINTITTAVLEAVDASDFARLLNQHEAILSTLLEMPTVKQSLFPDFTGTVKSLGGWGGDFVLAVAEENPSAYFKQKGFDTVVPYSEMIL